MSHTSNTQPIDPQGVCCASSQLPPRPSEEANIQRASLVSLIAAQASTSPQALAISTPDAQILYKDLARYSDNIARRLRSLGVESGSRVAICLPRSATMIICALAVFKAGGTYVSLDPSHPTERLNFALNDCNATCLLTDVATEHKLVEVSFKVLAIDPALEFVDRDESVTSPPDTSASDSAYIIYTSGSTGRPRGVEVTQAGLLNLVRWHIRKFGVVASDRATQIASPAFDAAVWEIWPYLVSGASLHIPADHNRNSAEALRDYLVSQRISIAFAPTILAERLIALPWPREVTLRTMLTGGDTLHHYPPSNLPFQLVNNYGPTEASVVTTSTIVTATDDPAHLPPIGMPIDNCQVYILNEQLQTVAAGDDGEICIGGVGVARGYLNCPELTNERFIVDPFSSNSADRLYRSGDRGRALPNGEILFLGRIDDQIKLRGYRIEPQEIVAVINSHPSIIDSVVTLGTDVFSEPCLCAYLVLDSSTLTRLNMVEFLGKKLPTFMIPAVFVRLDSLPATDNGKVDRAALPLPSPENMLPERPLSAPVTGIQDTIAAIVSELLGVQQIETDENFFLMGGNSLLGTQVIAKVQNTFGVELPLRLIFEHPTVAELSSEVERLMVSQTARNDVEASRVVDESSAV